MKKPKIKVVETFVSLQGEGTRGGVPCSFIRLAGCPMRCAWCDTVYARDPEAGEGRSVESLVSWAGEEGRPLVCVTGGEPLAQPATPRLLGALAGAGFEVVLETGGSFSTAPTPPEVVVVLDVKCPSSGMAGRNLWDNLDRLRSFDEVKFVLADREDYDYARKVIADRSLIGRCAVLLSPAGGLLDPSRLAGWILEDRLEARLGLQLHKILWPGEERGR